jgi:hypothetical protein
MKFLSQLARLTRAILLTMVFCVRKSQDFTWKIKGDGRNLRKFFCFLILCSESDRKKIKTLCYSTVAFRLFFIPLTRSLRNFNAQEQAQHLWYFLNLLFVFTCTQEQAQHLWCFLNLLFLFTGTQEQVQHLRIQAVCVCVYVYVCVCTCMCVCTHRYTGCT